VELHALTGLRVELRVLPDLGVEFHALAGLKSGSSRSR
jgi:hypothetical protein